MRSLVEKYHTGSLVKALGLPGDGELIEYTIDFDKEEITTRCTTPINKINSIYTFQCMCCGKLNERPDTVHQGGRKFCNRSCQATFSNKNRKGKYIHKSGWNQSEEWKMNRLDSYLKSVELRNRL